MVQTLIPPDRHPCIAVIGAGYWGRNLIRNFDQLDGLAAICDTRPQVLAQFQADYPTAFCTVSYTELLQRPDVLGVVIATPGQTHFHLARQAIEAGKHVYVEKPLTTTLSEALLLAQLADEAQRVLMVGHLLVHHPVVNRLKLLIKQGVLGQIGYLHSDRLNWNQGRADSGVLWDLAPHDLSMMIYLLDQEPLALEAATGIASNPADGKVDDVQLVYGFPGGVTATIHTSWVYPKKQVQLIVKGTQATALFDDTLPLERKLQIIHHGRPGQWDIEPVEALPLEPLKLECQHFINAVRDGLPIQTGIESGVGVTRWLEAADETISEQSRRLPVPG